MPVRKAKNPATKPTNKVKESYNEKRNERRGSGNYLPKVKEPLQSGSSPLQKKDACYAKVKARLILLCFPPLNLVSLILLFL